VPGLGFVRTFAESGGASGIVGMGASQCAVVEVGEAEESGGRAAEFDLVAESAGLVAECWLGFWRRAGRWVRLTGGRGGYRGSGLVRVIAEGIALLRTAEAGVRWLIAGDEGGRLLRGGRGEGHRAVGCEERAERGNGDGEADLRGETGADRQGVLNVVEGVLGLVGGEVGGEGFEGEVVPRGDFGQAEA
jgi:hypothetical protein